MIQWRSGEQADWNTGNSRGMLDQCVGNIAHYNAPSNKGTVGGRNMFSREPALANFITFAVFIVIVWFWLFITAASDLFRRRDISGFGKVAWVIVLIVLPHI